MKEPIAFTLELYPEEMAAIQAIAAEMNLEVEMMLQAVIRAWLMEDLLRKMRGIPRTGEGEQQ